jgi:hypothetical protein
VPRVRRVRRPGATARQRLARRPTSLPRPRPDVPPAAGPRPETVAVRVLEEYLEFSCRSLSTTISVFL